MVDDGLLLIGKYLSAMICDTFAKVTPNELRQQQKSSAIFNRFGPTFTLNIYEKLFDNFGLITTSDGTSYRVPYPGSSCFTGRK